jgi:hypothetical protein
MSKKPTIHGKVTQEANCPCLTLSASGMEQWIIMGPFTQGGKKGASREHFPLAFVALKI